jgi:hypothetical protein
VNPPRRTAFVALVAVLGIVLAAAITYGTSQLVRQHIGLASEPITAGRTLQAHVITIHVRVTPHAAPAPHSTSAKAPAPATTSEPAPAPARGSEAAPPATSTSSGSSSGTAAGETSAPAGGSSATGSSGGEKRQSTPAGSEGSGEGADKRPHPDD